MNAPPKDHARVDAVDSLLCVGLDSEFDKLPDELRDAVHPQFGFNKQIIEATHTHAAAYKLNIAFYETRGAAGFEDLKLTTDYLRQNHPDIFLFCDAKRGEVINTNIQNVITLFDYFGFDGATVNPYLGGEPLAPFLEREDKAVIVVCRTSNPGAREFQDLNVEGKPLWRVVAEKVRDEWNARGNCMIVAGATYPQEMATLRELMGAMTFLVPGVGAQGGDVAAMVKAGLHSEGKGLIVVSARGIIFADDPEKEARELKDTINSFR